LGWKERGCTLLKGGPSAPKKCELINMANAINYFKKRNQLIPVSIKANILEG